MYIHNLGGGADAEVAELEPEHCYPQLAFPATGKLVEAKLSSIHLDLITQSVWRESDFKEEILNLGILRTLQEQSLFTSKVTCRFTSQNR